MDLAIEMTTEPSEGLESLVVPVARLKKAGYVLGPLDLKTLGKKVRCVRCARNPKKRIRPPKPKEAQTADAIYSSHATGNGAEPLEVLPQAFSQHSNVTATNKQMPVALDGGIVLKPEGPQGEANTPSQKRRRENRKPQNTENKTLSNAKDEVPEIDQCYWHPELFDGRLKIFPCCGKNSFAWGCHSQLTHLPEYMDRQFMQRWTYYYTPLAEGPQTRKAVALDCEMGMGKNGHDELIRLSMVDFYSGEVLIDRLVFPRDPLLHCSSRFSGIFMKDLRQAQRARTCFMGRDQARLEVWKYVGPKTIVVLHGGTGDLGSLRWIHNRVVDTVIVEKSLPDNYRIGALSLKKLCESRLDLLIQQGRFGHCSLEDARATRSLAEFYVDLGLGLGPEMPGQRNDEQAANDDIYEDEDEDDDIEDDDTTNSEDLIVLEGEEPNPRRLMA